jgi:thiamine pyrophosphokinase
MDNLLILPQVQFTFSQALPAVKVMLVAGGRPPQREWLSMAAGHFPVWCVDRGIDSCHAGQVIPQYLIGDGDSATAAGWTWAQTLGIPVEGHPVDKDLTDLQLALQKVGAEYEEAAVILTGVWGGRFDHLFSNIYSLMGSVEYGIQRGCAADEQEVLVILRDQESVQIECKHRPEVVSLLPLTPHCAGVSVDGVHWPLTNVDFDYRLPYAISNRLNSAGTKTKVALKTGCMGVYLSWEPKGIYK